MFLALLVTTFPDGELSSTYASMLPSLLLLLITGICDDLLDLSAASRFVSQAVTALLMIYQGDLAITNLGDLFGGGAIRLAGWSAPFTVFCVVGVINAVNMLDGIDGLASGVLLAALMVFGCAALLSGNANQATLLFATAGAVAGFAAFNMRSPWRPRAAVFMGDSGSMILGFIVAWFAIGLSNQPTPAFSPITAVWILSVPLIDTVSLMLRRIAKGRSPFAPDHDHLHHIFLRAGFSVPQTVAVIVSLSLALGLVGIGGWYSGIPDYAMFYAFLLLFSLYFFGMIYAWKLMKMMRGVYSLMFGQPAK